MAKHLSETRTETLIMDLLNIQGWATGRPPHGCVVRQNDDCLLLLPKEEAGLPLSCMFIAAALIRLERWRFSYGRKLTPLRIHNFRMSRMPELEKWVDEQLERWKSITENTVSLYSV